MVASPAKAKSKLVQRLLKQPKPIPASVAVTIATSCTPLHTAVLRSDTASALRCLQYIESPDNVCTRHRGMNKAMAMGTPRFITPASLDAPR
ncbi:hypothetical protein ACHHYP_20096 [Achlya hypogyna]|uniref:Uncharacterized protein n=1 Tax=Achlya hypogyna TaxID=1202772 RepID=A0A1V9ZS51_ACHHY|nr:hypothetical protein ACHHYP_20096 [Achlya hypogyna]